MNPFKSLLTPLLTLAACLGLAALVFDPPAAHAQYALTTVATTNSAPSNGTPCIVQTSIPVTRGRLVAIQPRFNLTSAGTSNVLFSFSTSLNNDYWQTNVFTVQCAGAGTGSVTCVSNIDIGAAAYIRLEYISNNSAGSVTGLVLRTGQKTGI